MKKKYLQPTTEVIGILPIRILDVSRGWSKDGNPPFTVEKEEDDEDDEDDDDFLDLD